MEQLQNLEVVINRRGAKFRASSPSFPRCFGEAETAEVAIKKLGASIARFIGRTAHDALDGVFGSENFTELLLDTTVPKPEERRIYSFSKIQAQVGRNLMVRVQPKQSLLSGGRQEKPQMPSMRLPALPADLLPELADLIDDEDNNPNDGIVFGFPLNFN